MTHQRFCQPREAANNEFVLSLVYKRDSSSVNLNLWLMTMGGYQNLGARG